MNAKLKKQYRGDRKYRMRTLFFLMKRKDRGTPSFAETHGYGIHTLTTKYSDITKKGPHIIAPFQDTVGHNKIAALPRP